jgi:phage gp36-like protein
MATVALIDDAELLSMGMASEALNGVDVAVRNQARESASALAYSHIRKRHTLPLQSWGDDVKRAVAHVAAYDLLVFRGFSPNAGGDANLRDRYLESLQWLRDLAKGLIEADIVDSTATDYEGEPLVDTAGDDGPLWPEYGSS